MSGAQSTAPSCCIDKDNVIAISDQQESIRIEKTVTNTDDISILEADSPH